VRYIRPRRPQQNGKVERSHRIDEEEFWLRYHGQDFDAAAEALAVWEHRYNHERFSMALRGSTPMEKLAAMLAPPVVMARRRTPCSERARPPDLPRRTRAANG
jgi:transposase InsO family protein